MRSVEHAERPLHPFRAPAVIFWVALGARVAAILVGHTFHVRHNDADFDFGFEAGRIARSVVRGEGYANPFNGISGPTAWLPPLYPLLIALAFRLFGVYTRAAALFLLVMNSAFSALIAPAVFEIAARCVDASGRARRASRYAAPVALWSAWMWALYPAALQYAVHWIWEMSLSACLFSWALVIALRLRGIGEGPNAVADEGTGAARLWVWFGVLWGLIALSNASLLLMFPASLVWIVWPGLTQWRVGGGGAAWIGRAVLSCVIFGAVMAPWVLRNARALHAFVPTRSNFGVEFWRSTQFAQNGPFPWGTAMPLSPHDRLFQRYVAEGEVRFARERNEIAQRNLRAHPALFVRYTLERIQFFWACTPHAPEKHPVLEYLRVLQYAFVSVAGLLGLALMLRERVPGASLFALAFLLVPLVYYGVTVQPRFRHPLEPLLTICAVYLFRRTTPRAVRAAVIA